MFYFLLNLTTLRLDLSFRQSNDHKRPFAGFMPITLAAFIYRDVGRITKAPKLGIACDVISKLNQSFFDISLQKKQASRLAFFIFYALLIVSYLSNCTDLLRCFSSRLINWRNFRQECFDFSDTLPRIWMRRRQSN